MNDKRVDWVEPRELLVPRPTAWPIGLAVGITLLLLSIVTTEVVTIGGGIVTVVSLAGWIGEMLREGPTSDEEE